MRRAAAGILAFACLAATPLTGRQAPDDRAERLAILGRIWVAVKFSHPRVALTSRDWDAVLTTTLPAVEAATDGPGFEQAVSAMLATLDDPVTRVRAESQAAATPTASPRPPAISTDASGAVLIDLRSSGIAGGPAPIAAAVKEHLQMIAGAERLIVDLRNTAREPWQGGQPLDALGDVLVGAPLALPAGRYVLHSGYKAQAGGAGFYQSEMVTSSTTVLKPRDGMRPRRVAFVVNAAAAVPPLALALRAAGLGAIVAVGKAPPTPVQTISIPMGGGSAAVIRVADLTIAGRRIELTTDTVFDAAEPDARVYARAAELIAAPREAAPGIEDPAPVWTPEKSYAEDAYPARAHRLLAVYRLWGVMDNFFPYKHLMDRPWGEALTAFIPRALAARDALEYARTITGMAAWLQDSHVGVYGSPALTKHLGEVPPPVSVRLIEGRPIVTRVIDTAAAPGITVGDEIVSVDGVTTEARMASIAECIVVSTPAGRNRVIGGLILSGAPGSVARIVVRGADGRTRELTATRPAKPAVATQRIEDPIRILDGNIGYADLEQLQVPQVDPMFTRFNQTAAIIFDMRGYPRGTAWSIAPRINTKKATAAALFQRPLLARGSTFERLTFVQDLPPTTDWVYDRPTVMLIDERAISQSEHTGLFFKAANGTTFVGSPTTGANGDVTSTTLPGGLRVTFTGHDVRWPDGRQLQRVGLVPDVPVTPTIAGIRAGRDEVLEAALAFLKTRAGRLP